MGAPLKPNRESQVQQAAAKAADINHMVQQHMRGAGRFGRPLGDPAATRQPMYLDMPSASFHEQLTNVTRVQQEFMALPSRIRSKFLNNPYQMLMFIENPRNRPEAIKMGLVLPTEEEYQELRAKGVKSGMVDATQTSIVEGDGKEPKSAPKPDDEAQPNYQPQKQAGKSQTS